jgi:plastocyanin
MSGSDTMMVMADGLEPGTHTLFAVLVDNLHAPFDPPIVTKVEVEVADDGSATEAPAATAVSVEVSGLSSGDVVTANTLDLVVEPVGYEFDPTGIGKGAGDEVSHYHVVLDGALINAFAMPNASVSLQNVAPGEHSVMVVPATNDHTGIMEAASAIDFEYEPESALPEITAGEAAAAEPTVSIVSPAAGETISGAFEMVVDVTDFTLSGDLLGKANIDGFGHWHVFFDEVGMPNLGGMSGSDTMMVMADGLEPGTHTLFAVLVDNLHAPFDPPIVTKVEVEVADDGSAAAATGGTVDVSLQEWELGFDPDELTLAPGTYTFNATNDGTVDHALQITSGLTSAATPDTSYAPGETESFTVDLAPGTYEVFCPVAGHKAAGMVATITVTG